MSDLTPLYFLNASGVPTPVSASNPLPITGNQYYNVVNYGADITGATDSTAAIQAAINAAQNAGGGIVFFPSGTYTISSSLIISHNSIALLSAGEQGTTNIVISSSADPTYALIIGPTVNLTSCSISGLTFIGRGNNTSTGGGINIACTQCTISQVTVQQFGGTGINVAARSSTINQVLLQDVYLIQNGRNTTTPGDNLVIANTVTDSEYIRVIVDGAGSGRYGINNSGGTQKFTQCHPYLCASHGFYQGAGTGSTQIIGGEYETNGGDNIHFDAGAQNLVMGVHCFGNTTTADINLNTPYCAMIACECLSNTSGDNINVFGSANYCTIADSIVKNTNNLGIYINGNNTTVHDCSINTTGPAIYVDNVTFCDIHDNTFVAGSIVEHGTANNNNWHDNNFVASQVPTIVGANSAFRNNANYNPQSGSVTTPAVPASGTAIQNTTGNDCTIYILAGTITVIATGNASGTTVATGLLSNSSGVSLLLRAGQWIKLTYSVAPTWKWLGV